jgi:hypothetical protein
LKATPKVHLIKVDCVRLGMELWKWFNTPTDLNIPCGG